MEKINVLFPNESGYKSVSISQWQDIFKAAWQPTLIFSADQICDKIAKKCQKALTGQLLERRQIWLGTYFSKEINQGFVPQVAIAWIGEEIGYGVFAEQLFSPGDFVGEYVGVLRPRQKKQDERNNYCFEYRVGSWKSPYLIDAEAMGNHTRFINHSLTSNLEPVFVYLAGAMHLIFIAKTAIVQGEQLTYDYGELFWKKKKPPIPLQSSG